MGKVIVRSVCFLQSRAQIFILLRGMRLVWSNGLTDRVSPTSSKHQLVELHFSRSPLGALPDGRSALDQQPLATIAFKIKAQSLHAVNYSRVMIG
jgi:hypothetical protein